MTYYVVDAKCIFKFVIMCVCGAQRLTSDVLDGSVSLTS